MLTICEHVPANSRCTQYAVLSTEAEAGPKQWPKQMARCLCKTIGSTFGGLCTQGPHRTLTIHWKTSYMDQDKKRRILRHGGLQLAREKPLLERASEAAADVWRLCDNKPICIWIDNFAKRRKVPDPITEDAGIDCTVFAVLPTVGLFHFDGHYNLPQLVHRIGVCLEHLQEANTELEIVLKNITDGTVNRTDMRVPLDVRRPRA